jgi:predicted GH43/DUF377 family glycosyl hydrolase
MHRDDHIFDREGNNDLHWTATIYHDGKFYMFYNYGMAPSGPTPLMSGMAVSEDGIKFKTKNNMVLCTSIDSWDSRLVEVHSITRAEGEWRMYYCGYDGNWRIGMATSEDLTSWKKRPEPIMDLGMSKWEDTHVADPHVIFFGGKYLMYYMGKGQVWQVGIAMSHDGIEWNKYIENPIIKANQSWCDGCVALSGVIIYKNMLLASVHGYSTAEKKFRTKLFKSEDGIKWEPTDIVINPGHWSDRGIVHPEIIAIDDKLIVYYTGIKAGNPNQHRVGRVVFDDEDLLL